MVEIGYRYIPSAEVHTPRCHLPMQRMRLEVAEPRGRREVVEALLAFFGEGVFESRDAIRDVEVDGRKV